ncbi:hypothetical protein [Agrobacterium tumefaciens]
MSLNISRATIKRKIAQHGLKRKGDVTLSEA